MRGSAGCRFSMWRVQDATGTVHAVFFNQPYLEDVLKEGVRVMMSGTCGGRSAWVDRCAVGSDAI